MKLEAQRLTGVFVETLRIRMDVAEETFRAKMPSDTPLILEEQCIKARRDAITDVERKILDRYCDRIKHKDADADEDDTDKSKEADSDLDGETGDQEKFLHSFTMFLYSGNYPRERDFKGFVPEVSCTKPMTRMKTTRKTRRERPDPV